ncbi:hypothetical protein E2562_025278 [Oryza meyeriana var. granulata]|uniref:CCHC-type domain-containing protein n=1 Tax=Oryza meyeriana var. granulata TaxID=110450 RepID=A0A6G1BNJ7_9ORYZ|nr:hypothetical protein E2562_025278 [Oryza meyeriana var. granulata]
MYKAKKQELEEASPSSKKTIALKTEVEDKGKSRVDEDKSDDLDDEIALLAKRFNELLGRRKGKGNDFNSYRRRGRRDSHKRSLGNLRCFDYLEKGHFASNCPNKEKEEDKSSSKKSGKEKLFKKLKKKGKKIEAFFGEWNSNDESSEAQSSSSNDSDEEKATKRKSMAGVTIKEAPSLFSPFCLMAKGSTKNNELKEQVTKLNKSLERCFKAKNTLDKILSEQWYVLNKEGLGFVAKKGKKPRYRSTKFVKSNGKYCQKCWEVGHVESKCPGGKPSKTCVFDSH